MADAYVSALLEKLVSIPLQQAKQELRLVVSVEKEVRKLTSNLHAIQTVLEDAERRQVKEATVKHWLAKLKDVSYDMDDLLDEWNTEILKMQIEGDEDASKPKKVFSFIISCCCFRQFSLCRDIAIKIKELNERLAVVSIEKDRFNFILARGIEEPEPLMTASVVDVSVVHGRDHDKEKIVDMLTSESSQGPTLRIISIVGMAGIGKTTLAQLVYNDDTVKDHFETRIWVCVSDPFDEVRIAKEILESLTNSVPNLNELDSLFYSIRRSIEGKKFLLVLDDVWTDDYRRLEQLKHPLKGGSPGSKILVTTRKEVVAKIMGATHIFRLGLLSDEECWSLFSQIAFFGRSNEESEKLEGIGRKIVDKCKGLPLAAKTLGSLLRFKITREEWQSVLNSEVWKLEEAEQCLFPPLLLSYYDMSPTIRRCFSYCAIFPKDYELNKDELIHLWMAQGFLNATRNGEMEMIGEECFENLAMRSFFQDFERNEKGSIIKCKMHDIVHDFAQFLTMNECLVMEVSSPQEPMIESSYVKARHLMMILSVGVSIPISIYHLKNLHSLIVDYRASLPIDLGLPELFDQLTCLRALDFRWHGPNELPREVGKLKYLRYLNLTGSSELEALPETVCELCNLQILNVSFCIRLKKLPHGLGKLINLRHLEIWGTSIEFMPKGIERLTCLRTLDMFAVSDGDNDGEASALGSLKNLNQLRGRLWIQGLGNVRDMDEVKKAQLKNKEHLIGLTLEFSGRMENDEQVIEAIQPPPNLEQLSIVDYGGTSVFPNWIMSLTNLKKVRISDCGNCDLLPPLGKLSSLESLDIRGMSRVKRVGIELLGIQSGVNKNEVPSKKDEANTSSPSSSVIAFPKLETLSLWGMANWEEWDYGMGEEEDITTTATTNILIMPRLRSLTISSCPKLTALPDHILHKCPLLKELDIWSCPILSERYYKERRKGEDWPNISHIPKIRINGDYVQRDGKPPKDESWSDSE